MESLAKNAAPSTRPVGSPFDSCHTPDALDYPSSDIPKHNISSKRITQQNFNSLCNSVGVLKRALTRASEDVKRLTQENALLLDQCNGLRAELRQYEDMVIVKLLLFTQFNLVKG
jgi:hypothetical protein